MPEISGTPMPESILPLSDSGGKVLGQKYTKQGIPLLDSVFQKGTPCLRNLTLVFPYVLEISFKLK